VNSICETCTVCSKEFEVQFRYQMEDRDGAFSFYCSQRCLEESKRQAASGQRVGVVCDCCGKRFQPELVSQVFFLRGRRTHACTAVCREQLRADAGLATSSVTLRGKDAGELLQSQNHEGAGAQSQPRGAHGPLDSEGLAEGEGLETLLALRDRVDLEPAVKGPALKAETSERRSASGSRSLADRAEASAESTADDEAAASFFGALQTRPVAQFGTASSPATAVPLIRAGTVGGDTDAVVGQAGRPAARFGAGATGWLEMQRGGLPRVIAVFNHKGGTGKTTTSVSVAAGLALRGKKVLLVDTDAQGNVAVSLGAKSERSLYHVLVMGLRIGDATQTVRENLDLLPSNESLAAAELYLAGRQNRDRVLSERLMPALGKYDYIVLDCSPSLSLMNQNALVFADSVLVPVGCDYLSLVGVRQVVKTVKNVNTLLRHPVRIWGVLPTFYDGRAKIAREAVEALQAHFGERCLPPVRMAIKVKEAPSQGKTLFEYAPWSHAAQDYLVVVDAIMAAREGSVRTDAKDNSNAVVRAAHPREVLGTPAGIGQRVGGEKVLDSGEEQGL
jgi:chromosome partitioning protein